MKPCFMRMGSEPLAQAMFFTSIGDAKAAFYEAACELHRYGQALDASLHFVDSSADAPDEYPDRIITLGKNGRGVREEKT